MSSTSADAASFDQAQDNLRRIQNALNTHIVGQQPLISDLLVAVVCGGHVLLEGLPGMGKTRLTQVLAAAIGLDMKRIQCTPDLIPADITGSETLIGGELQQLGFRQGPIFANLVLVDEINRATPRTQSALLEAMQEGQVTHLGQSYSLPQPFRVLATQNPIELEGTFPLPEAQLDRFLFKLAVAMPDAAALMALLELSLQPNPDELPQPVVNGEQLQQITGAAQQVLVAKSVREAAVALIQATQPTADNRDRIRHGVSPRGLQALVKSAQAQALLHGRSHVALEDLATVSLPALRHRLLLSHEAELEGLTSDQVLMDIVAVWQGTQSPS